ncbi:glycosyltransferase family 2 protein [Gallibacterium genomosp. 1]|uniref:glycosyltransferase family 2 protein n=1 Tax=Gallibacterium genomosp. 1 TaxID=155515 RepID=UPI000802703C|nr:glycosyltransferase family 2 protein [Gallibacterium genomosp. 1]
MMEKKCFFWICVPVYNVEAFLKDCLDSVLNQTYQNFRVVLVNDGSTDDSGTICDEYANRDKRISVIHKKNEGQISARQMAMKFVLENANKISQNLAFLVYLDSDDSLKQNALEKINNTINKYSCDMVIYGMDRVYKDKVIKSFENKDIFDLIEDKRVLYTIVFNDSDYNPVCRKAINTALLNKLDYSQYFHIKHAEDLLQSIDYYKRASKIYFLNEALYNYTLNPQSITQTVSYQNFKVDFTVREKVLAFLMTENVFSRENWVQYYSYCILQITNTVKTIFKFNTPLLEKIKLCDQIYNSSYYKSISVANLDKKRLGSANYFIYTLFKNKAYFILNIIFYIYKVLK